MVLRKINHFFDFYVTNHFDYLSKLSKEFVPYFHAFLAVKMRTCYKSELICIKVKFSKSNQFLLISKYFNFKLTSVKKN